MPSEGDTSDYINSQTSSVVLTAVRDTDIKCDQRVYSNFDSLLTQLDARQKYWCGGHFLCMLQANKKDTFVRAKATFGSTFTIPLT